MRKRGLIEHLNVRNFLPFSLWNSLLLVKCTVGLQRDKANKCCIVGNGGLRCAATGLGCLHEEE